MTAQIGVIKTLYTISLLIFVLTLFITKRQYLVGDGFNCTNFIPATNKFVTPSSYTDDSDFYTLRFKNNFSIAHLDDVNLANRESNWFCLQRANLKIEIRNPCYVNQFNSFDFCIIDKSLSDCDPGGRNASFFNDQTGDILDGIVVAYPIANPAVIKGKIHSLDSYMNNYYALQNMVLKSKTCVNQVDIPVLFLDPIAYILSATILIIVLLLHIVSEFMVHVQIGDVNSRIQLKMKDQSNEIGGILLSIMTKLGLKDDKELMNKINAIVELQIVTPAHRKDSDDKEESTFRCHDKI